MASKGIVRAPLRSLHDGSQENAVAIPTAVKKVPLKRKPKTFKDTQLKKGHFISSDSTNSRDCSSDTIPISPRVVIPPVIQESGELYLLNYQDKILEYMSSLESRNSLPADYLQHTKGKITPENRAILVDWIVEVSGCYEVLPETLHTAIILLDTFMSKYPITKSRLQLAGLAVYWIATKVEEYQAMEVGECISLLGASRSSTTSLLRMERLVLQTLKFQTLVSEPVFYLRRALSYVENGSDPDFINTCTYCLDSSLIHMSTIAESSSDLASAALYAARLVYGDFSWTMALGYVTGHWPTPQKLNGLALLMIKSILEGQDKSSVYRGTFKKYSRRSYNRLSLSERFSEDHLQHVLNHLS